MGDTANTKTESVSERPADISDGLKKSPPSESTEKSELKSTAGATAATTPSDSPKTLKKMDVEGFRLKLGLLGGALADLLGMKATAVIREFQYTAPSGSKCTGLKILVAVDGFNLVAVDSPDGLEFNLVAATENNLVAEEK